MTTTSGDCVNGDQDDIMREDDFTPHLSHPGTETTENPNEFHNFPPDFLFLGCFLPIFWAAPISFPISGRRPKPIF